MATKEGYFQNLAGGDVSVFIPEKGGRFNISVKNGQLKVMFCGFGRIKVLPEVANVVTIDVEDFS